MNGLICAILKTDMENVIRITILAIKVDIAAPNAPYIEIRK